MDDDAITQYYFDEEAYEWWYFDPKTSEWKKWEECTLLPPSTINHDKTWEIETENESSLSEVLSSIKKAYFRSNSSSTPSQSFQNETPEVAYKRVVSRSTTLPISRPFTTVAELLQANQDPHYMSQTTVSLEPHTTAASTTSSSAATRQLSRTITSKSTDFSLSAESTNWAQPPTPDTASDAFSSAITYTPTPQASFLATREQESSTLIMPRSPSTVETAATFEKLDTSYIPGPAVTSISSNESLNKITDENTISATADYTALERDSRTDATTAASAFYQRYFNVSQAEAQARRASTFASNMQRTVSLATQRNDGTFSEPSLKLPHEIAEVAMKDIEKASTSKSLASVLWQLSKVIKEDSTGSSTPINTATLLHTLSTIIQENSQAQDNAPQSTVPTVVEEATKRSSDRFNSSDVAVQPDSSKPATATEEKDDLKATFDNTELAVPDRTKSVQNNANILKLTEFNTDVNTQSEKNRAETTHLLEEIRPDSPLRREASVYDSQNSLSESQSLTQDISASLMKLSSQYFPSKVEKVKKTSGKGRLQGLVESMMNKKAALRRSSTEDTEGSMTDQLAKLGLLDAVVNTESMQREKRLATAKCASPVAVRFAASAFCDPLYQKQFRNLLVERNRKTSLDEQTNSDDAQDSDSLKQ